MEAVHRTNFDAVGVLALDAVLGDDEGHERRLPAVIDLTGN
jgi:hypothetical protein